MSDTPDAQDKGGLGAGFWIMVIRGMLLIILALSLLVIPDKTHKMLFNAMGLFWLTSGLVIARREAHARGNRLVLVAAIVGALTGLAVVTRDLSRQWLAEVWIKGLLGAVILLTGVIHVTTQLRYGSKVDGGRPLASLVLGAAEIVLGALLIMTPTGREQAVYYAAIVWALVTGLVVLVKSVRQWLQGRR
jgi:uncharacterized membrane protein HdeD (DUF308 family)